MTATKYIVFSFMILGCASQRPSYAGRRPIGYPELEPASTVPTEVLVNRFGEDAPSSTTMRLPLEALGDVNLVNRISKLPIDQQPFWYLNWQALEANRKNPQTYPQKENPFINILTNTKQEKTTQRTIR